MTYLMENSADPEKPTDLAVHCLQRQDISVISRTRFKVSRTCYMSGIQFGPDQMLQILSGLTVFAQAVCPCSLVK